VREATLACVRLTAFAASTGSVCKSSGSASSGIGRCSLVESTSQMIGVGAAHRSKQRPPRTPPRISARLPQPRQLLRQITPRDRRLQTPTTPSIAMSPTSSHQHLTLNTAQPPLHLARQADPCHCHLHPCGYSSRSSADQRDSQVGEGQRPCDQLSGPHPQRG
jgi:hypothetical protein